MPGRQSHRKEKGWKARRTRVLRRDKYQCQLRLEGCFGRASAVDHIVPLSLGGEDTDENCQAVCFPCHKKKSKNDYGEWHFRFRNNLRPDEGHPSDNLDIGPEIDNRPPWQR